MKKFLTMLLVGILAVCCVAMTACKKPEEPTADVYEIYSLSAQGVLYEIGDTVPAYVASATEFVLTKDYMIFEFKDNGVATAKQDGQLIDADITWTKDGNTYTITQTRDGSSEPYVMTAVVDGEYLTMEAGPSVIYTFKKA